MSEMWTEEMVEASNEVWANKRRDIVVYKGGMKM